MLVNVQQYTGKPPTKSHSPPPPQIIICPKMSVVPRFRRLHLEKMELFSIPVRITPGNRKKRGGEGWGESKFSVA